MQIALAGGVGGAKLAFGLAGIRGADELAIIVNTGDDFDHLGLRICPDIDTVIYTLAGIANPETGWGIRNETWSFMEALERQNGETWFRLGDRDLETHITRTNRLAEGATLSTVIAEIAEALGVSIRILPASDDPIRTEVVTPDGILPFQEYFVRHACTPPVEGFLFAGAGTASPAPGVIEAFRADSLDSIVICPSNPYVSIGPVLAVDGIRAEIQNRTVPCIAVSPIVGGAALKGPLAKMMVELGTDPSPMSVAECYRGLLDGLVIDSTDADCVLLLEESGLAVLTANIVMSCDDDRRRLASEVTAFARSLA